MGMESDNIDRRKSNMDDYLSPEDYLERVKALEEHQKQDASERWKVFYSSVTLHGFHYIFDQTGVRKLAWLILLAASGFLSFYLFQDIITDFSKLKTIAISREVYSNDSMPFPTVSLCPFNAITHRAIGKEDKNDQFWEFFRNLDQGSTNKTQLTKHLAALKEDMGRRSNQEFIEAFELNLGDMMNHKVVELSGFEKCEFNKKPCNTSMFESAFLFPYDKYGICHQFNMFEENKKGKKAKSGRGLSMTLNLFTDDMAIEKYPYHGLAIFLHPYGSPLSTHHATFIPVSPGTVNTIYVAAEEKHLLPPPYDSNCGEKKYNYMLPGFKYSKAMCELDCQAKYLLNKSKCLDLQFKQFVDEKYFCKNESQFIEYISATKDLTNEKRNIRNECHSTCPMECKRLRYTISHSQAIIGAKNTFEEVMSIPDWNYTYEQTKEYVRSNILYLSINFKDQSRTEHDLVPSVTWTSMIGSVGGTLGLCLGFSLLTLCEFLYFAFDIVLSIFRLNKSKKNMKRRTTIRRDNPINHEVVDMETEKLNENTTS